LSAIRSDQTVFFRPQAQRRRSCHSAGAPETAGVQNLALCRRATASLLIPSSAAVSSPVASNNFACIHCIFGFGVPPAKPVKLFCTPL